MPFETGKISPGQTLERGARGMLGEFPKLLGGSGLLPIYRIGPRKRPSLPRRRVRITGAWPTSHYLSASTDNRKTTERPHPHRIALNSLETGTPGFMRSARVVQ